MSALVLFSMFAGVCLLYLAVMLALAYLSVWPPRVPVFFMPAQLGEPQEPVTLVTEDGLRLAGWWCQGSSRTVVVFTHGYLANRSELVPYGPRLRARGASAFYIDHRCHGGSQRSKCGFGVLEAADVQAAVRYAKEREPCARIVLFGSSMGAVAAIRACARQPGLADALVLDAPYARLDEAASGFWQVTGIRWAARLMAPVTLLGRLWAGQDPKKVNTIEAIKAIQGMPALFLFGDCDTVVSTSAAKACVQAAGPLAEVAWFEGCAHGQARYQQPERYFDTIARFLEKHAALETVPKSPEESLTFSGPEAV